MTLLTSIVIPSRNNTRFLISCLESIYNQSVQNFEVIVVDNGSIADLSLVVKPRFPSAQVVRLEYNAFFCRSVNIGISRSRGRYLALVNDDTEFSPNWLENVLKTFSVHPNAGSVASKIMSLRKKGYIDSVGDHLLPNGRAGNRGWGELDSGQYDVTSEVFSAAAAGAVYQREFLQEAGGFDESFKAYYDDVDLGFRLQLLGYPCVYSPNAVMYHFGGGSKNSATRSLKLAERNLILNLAKNMPSQLLLKYQWEILSTILSPARLSAWHEAGSEPPRRDFLTCVLARLSAVRFSSCVLKQRRLVQSRRRVSVQYIDDLLNSSSLERFHL